MNYRTTTNFGLATRLIVSALFSIALIFASASVSVGGTSHILSFMHAHIAHAQDGGDGGDGGGGSSGDGGGCCGGAGDAGGGGDSGSAGGGSSGYISPAVAIVPPVVPPVIVPPPPCSGSGCVPPPCSGSGCVPPPCSGSGCSPTPPCTGSSCGQGGTPPGGPGYLFTCPYGYIGAYPSCVLPGSHIAYVAPIYPPAAVHIILRQVPYTGLDLGFLGTVIYWMFMAAWVAFAAYLIAIKRVQNTLAEKLNAFLFGEVA